MHSLKYLLEKCSRILLCWIAMYGLMTNEVPYVLSGLTVHYFLHASIVIMVTVK